MPDVNTHVGAAGRRSNAYVTGEEELRALEQHLWPRGMSRDMWMIVDSARDRRIFPMLLECHLEYSCLYAGPLHPALEIVAPYLVQLDYDYRDTRRFLRESWRNSWGVFIRCDTGMDRLRRHLREFLIVKDASGRRLLFRYYDPRVFRMYLPTCNSEEARTVFGPIDAFLMEDEAPGRLLHFALEHSRVVKQEFPLATQT